MSTVVGIGEGRGRTRASFSSSADDSCSMNTPINCVNYGCHPPGGGMGGVPTSAYVRGRLLRTILGALAARHSRRDARKASRRRDQTL